MAPSTQDPEFQGSAPQVALQRAVWERTVEATSKPGLFHGGRLIGIDDLARVRDAEVERIYGDVGAVIVKFIAAGEEADFRARFDAPERRFTAWDVFTGGEAARRVSADLVAGFALPSGWLLDVLAADAPADDILAIQALQDVCGVAPVPGYYQRGAAVPAVVTVLRDDGGRVVATAQAYERHRGNSPWTGYIFGGMVAVRPDHRRRGFGALVNAHVVVEAFARLDCTHVYEHARADNWPSRGMIEASGLVLDPRYRCVMFHDAGRFGEEFTK